MKTVYQIWSKDHLYEGPYYSTVWESKADAEVVVADLQANIQKRVEEGYVGHAFRSFRTEPINLMERKPTTDKIQTLVIELDVSAETGQQAMTAVLKALRKDASIHDIEFLRDSTATLVEVPRRSEP